MPGVVRCSWPERLLILRRTPILTLALLSLLAVVPSATRDPRVGTWTLVAAQASLTPANTLSINDVQGGVHVAMSGETYLNFTAKSDGHVTPVPGNPRFDQVEVHRINKRQSEVEEKKDGNLVATVSEKLSSDGKELTITSVSPGHANQIAVWTRSGGAKTAHDPLAGEWTQDLSKTLLRQGLVLRIDPDGNGGVHFSGQFSYTGRFDGKPYDLQNSRNDTVSLALANPHTVESTYRRDGQVTQRATWVVSADGKQMTMTTTGVYENGQHLTEKLVFKKQ